MLVIIYDNHHGGGNTLDMFVPLGLNPVMTIVSCYCVLNKPGQSKAIPIVGGLFLGFLFAAFNLYLGMVGGCAAVK